MSDTGYLTMATAAKWPVKIFMPPLGELAPADDITAKEAACIAMMLAMCAASGAASRVDYASFVRENNLTRHFKGEGGTR